MRLQGKQIALFIENLFEDAEGLYPYFRMIEEEADVHLIGPKAEVYKGKHGYPLRARRGIDDVTADTYDAVIIPGGFAPDYMRREQKMVDFVKDMHAAGKVVAAICHGGWMLASAKIVDGKQLTTFSGIKDDLIHAGANYTDEEVVRDGTLITSRKPDDLPAFCRTIIEALS